MEDCAARALTVKLNRACVIIASLPIFYKEVDYGLLIQPYWGRPVLLHEFYREMRIETEPPTVVLGGWDFFGKCLILEMRLVAFFLSGYESLMKKVGFLGQRGF